jgi:A/G-specific adenine glycosylase
LRRDLFSFGLTWRADNLSAIAVNIRDQLGGKVPTDIDDLLRLPGVGPYVAAATLAGTTDAEVILVDTNTVRVAARVQGLFERGDIRRRPAILAAIRDLLDGPAPARDWWAVLDLAASICLPRGPRCSECPIGIRCATGIQLTSASV